MSQIPIPKDFVAWAKKRLGKEAKEFLDALDKPAVRSMLVNPRKNLELTGLEKVPWNDMGCYMPDSHQFTTDPLWHAGTYYALDASCMFLGHAFKQLCAKEEKMRVLDLCSAPGGMSLILSSLMNNEQLLVSNESAKTKAAKLKENVIKWGAAHNYVMRQKPEQFQRIPGFFDVMLLNAPHSGEGLFRKSEKARENWSLDLVQERVAKQRKILSDSLLSLKVGGTLLYCVRSFNEQETIENINWLCKEKGMKCLPLKSDKAWNIENIKEGKALGYQLWPHKTKGEGFFLSALTKVEGEEVDQGRYEIKKKTKPYSRKNTMRIKRYFGIPEGFMVHENGRKAITAVHENIMDDISALNGLFSSDYYGVELGMMAKEIFLPLHSLAVNGVVDSKMKMIPLTMGDAQKYLRRDSLEIDYDRPGWVRASYEEISLGWFKVQVRKLSNHYPIQWRLKK